MTVLQSIFLGLLQGLTEFLPVSSSGHLILAQKLFAIEGNLFFDVMLHLGTLAAVLVVMRREVWQVVRHPIQDKRALYVVIASIPTFILAFVVKMWLPEEVMGGILLPIGFALTIVLLTLSHYLSRPVLRLDEAKWWRVLLVGFTQGVAVIPGLSRSGSTISVMRLTGVNQSDSAEFSFLLSIPVILASGAVEVWEAIQTQLTVQWLNVAIGVVCAFVSGWVAIQTVMKLIKNNGFVIFAVYLVIPLIVSIILL